MYLLLDRFLVGTKVDVNAKTLLHGNTALHIATQNKDMKTVDKLLDKRFLPYVFINIQNHDFKLPLWLAAEAGHWEICKLLILKGSATEIRKKENNHNGRRIRQSSSSPSSKVIDYANHTSIKNVIIKAMKSMGGDHVIYRDNIPADPIKFDGNKTTQYDPLENYKEFFGDDNPKNNNTTKNDTNTNVIVTKIFEIFTLLGMLHSLLSFSPYNLHMI
jgi:ankyrin repeat protein